MLSIALLQKKNIVFHVLTELSNMRDEFVRELAETSALETNSVTRARPPTERQMRCIWLMKVLRACYALPDLSLRPLMADYFSTCLKAIKILRRVRSDVNCLLELKLWVDLLIYLCEVCAGHCLNEPGLFSLLIGIVHATAWREAMDDSNFETVSSDENGPSGYGDGITERVWMHYVRIVIVPASIMLTAHNFNSLIQTCLRKCERSPGRNERATRLASRRMVLLLRQLTHVCVLAESSVYEESPIYAVESAMQVLPPAWTHNLSQRIVATQEDAAIDNRDATEDAALQTSKGTSRSALIRVKSIVSSYGSKSLQTLSQCSWKHISSFVSSYSPKLHHGQQNSHDPDVGKSDKDASENSVQSAFTFLTKRLQQLKIVTIAPRELPAFTAAALTLMVGATNVFLLAVTLFLQTTPAPNGWTLLRSEILNCADTFNEEWIDDYVYALLRAQGRESSIKNLCVNYPPHRHLLYLIIFASLQFLLQASSNVSRESKNLLYALSVLILMVLDPTLYLSLRLTEVKAVPSSVKSTSCLATSCFQTIEKRTQIGQVEVWSWTEWFKSFASVDALFSATWSGGTSGWGPSNDAAEVNVLYRCPDDSLRPGIDYGLGCFILEGCEWLSCRESLFNNLGNLVRGDYSPFAHSALSYQQYSMKRMRYHSALKTLTLEQRMCFTKAQNALPTSQIERIPCIPNSEALWSIAKNVLERESLYVGKSTLIEAAARYSSILEKLR